MNVSIKRKIKFAQYVNIKSLKNYVHSSLGENPIYDTFLQSLGSKDYTWNVFNKICHHQEYILKEYQLWYLYSKINLK